MKRAVAGLALLIVGLFAGGASADCCNECGCQCQCCKVCRCVPDVKKVPKITYDCECEDFCVPGPSKICGYKCDCGCDGCDGHCSGIFSHFHRQPIYQPTCAKVHTRSKLVKHEEIKEVCSWKWVVEDLCPHCAAKAKQAGPGPDSDTMVQGAARGASGANENLEPIAASATSSENEEPAAQLVSHNPAAKSKRKLLSLFSK